jgi:hypothetical protein
VKKKNRKGSSFDDFVTSNSDLDDHRKVQHLRKLLSREKSLNKKLLRELDSIEERLKVCLDLKKARKVKHPKIRASGKNKAAQAVPVMLASDWHVGETVDPGTVNGKNEYNPEIAKERADKFFIAAAWMINNLSGWDMTTGVLWLGGDIITGYIHEELVESNSMSPTEEILFARDLFIRGIEYLLEQTTLTKLMVPCSFGNHGRTTPKRRIQTGYANSYEWLLYKILEGYYEDDDRVEFIVATGSHVYLDVYDKTIRFHHGDDVKFNGGSSGLLVPLIKAVDAWDEIKPADYTCIGHYHQAKDFGNAVVNGSLIGYNAFALSVRAGYEPPQQQFFIIDKKYGKRLVSPLKVE